MATATPSGGKTRASAGFIGSLAHTPSEVLPRLVVEERSGGLQVTGPSAIKAVYFDRGFVVFASSRLTADRFSEIPQKVTPRSVPRTEPDRSYLLFY